MYEKILLPTDGSNGNDRAVDQAIELAGETGAELHVLYVVEEMPYAPEMADGQLEGRMREIGEDAIGSIRRRAEADGIEFHSAIEDGKPHKVIIEYADREEADLIVMGTHGRSGLNRYLLGSVTERVVRSAEIPVLTVRRTRQE